MMKKIIKFASNNFIVILIALGVLFAMFISASKLFYDKSKYIYVKVKVSQGLWWANTSRPQIWMVNSLKPGLKESSLLGKPTAEVLSVTYYPWSDQTTNQFDIFMTMRLRVTGSGGKNGYEYARSALSVGSAVNFDFPRISISGTVVDLNEKPFTPDYEEHVISLSKAYALDWEYESIKVGDKYFNGKDVVFEIIDKSSVDEPSNILNFDSTYTGSAVGATVFAQSRKRINIKAKIRVKRALGYYIFGEEQVISTGKDFFLFLPSVVLNNYKITDIE